MTGRLDFDNIHAIDCKQGLTFSYTIEYEDVAGNTVDLSLYDIKMSVKDNPDSLSIIDLSTDNGRIFLDSNLAINLLIDSDDTTSLEPGNYFYSMITIKDGIKSEILSGVFKVSRAITL